MGQSFANLARCVQESERAGAGTGLVPEKRRATGKTRGRNRPRREPRISRLNTQSIEYPKR